MDELQQNTDDLDRLSNMQLSEYFKVFPITIASQIESHKKIDEILLNFTTAMINYPDDRDLTSNLIQLTIATISDLQGLSMNQLCSDLAMVELSKARSLRSRSKAEALTQVLIARGLCHLGVDISNRSLHN